MQLNRCPICHSRISIDALAQDESGRELLALLAKLDTETGTALIGYLSLFRSSGRDLSNDRALKLAKEALSLGASLTVAQAMRETQQSLQGRGGKKLTNHNYLKQVLATVTINPVQMISKEERPVPSGNPGKTAQALQALQDFGHD